VPLILVNSARRHHRPHGGKARGHRAPRCLTLLGLPKPASMTGKVLVQGCERAPCFRLRRGFPFGAGLALAVTLIVLYAKPGGRDTPRQKLRSVEQELEQGRQTTGGTHAPSLTRLRWSFRVCGAGRQFRRGRGRASPRGGPLDASRRSCSRLGLDETQKAGRYPPRNHAQEVGLLARAWARLRTQSRRRRWAALDPLASAGCRGATGILLGSTVPRLQSEARSLSLELGELHRLRQEIERKKLAVDLERRGTRQRPSSGLDGLDPA